MGFLAIISKKKASTFQSRPLNFFISTFHQAVVSVFRPPHTLLDESLRLQFPFVFRRLQSLQLLLPAHPCLLLSFPTFSRPSIPRLIIASCPLSDLRCFSFLSSASVLDSDYSASVLPFLFLPVSPSQWVFFGAPFRSRFFGFPRSF